MTTDIKGNGQPFKFDSGMSIDTIKGVGPTRSFARQGAIGTCWTLPVVQGDRRHFEPIGGFCVPGAFHPSDQVKLAGVDILTRRIEHRFVTNVNQQDLSEHQAEAA
jgi:hypothetical protein